MMHWRSEACGAGLALVVLAGAAVAQPAAPVQPPLQQDAPLALEFPGGTVWQRSLPAALAVRPAFDERHAYAALRDGTVVAVSLLTGRVTWTARCTSGVPLVTNGEMLLGADGARVWALAVDSGALRWESMLKAPPLSEPVATERLVVLPIETGELAAIGSEDGTPRWSTPLPARAASAPALTRTRILIGLADGHVVCLASDTGSPLWSRALGGEVRSVSADTDRVYAGSSDNFLYALDSRNGTLRWRWRTGGDVTEPAIADARFVYFVSLDNVVRALRKGNGNLVWQYALGSRPAGPPLLIEDRLVVAGIAPEIRSFDPEDGYMNGRYAPPDRLVHAPHFSPADGDVPARLTVLTGNGTALAIGGSMERPVGPPVTVPGRVRPPSLVVLAADIRALDGSVEVTALPMDAPPGFPAPRDAAQTPSAPVGPALPRTVPLYVVPGRPRPPRVVGWPLLQLDGHVEPPIGPLDFLPGKEVGPEPPPAYAPDGALADRQGSNTGSDASSARR